MPQRRTESRFMKRTGCRASSTGVGSRSYGVDELIQMGVSQTTVRRFRGFIEARVPVNDAMRLAIYATDRALYQRIGKCRDDDHATFRSQMRVYLRALKGRVKH